MSESLFAQFDKLPSDGLNSQARILLILQDMTGEWNHFPGIWSSPYDSDRTGIAWVTFDQTTGTKGSPTPRIFVAVATIGEDNVFVSEDAGATCKGLNSTGFSRITISHREIDSRSQQCVHEP